MLYVKDDVSGKMRKSVDVDFADRVIELKNDKGKWTVIEEIVKYWAKDSPEEVKGFKVHIKDIKETRKDQEYGQTKSKKQERRMTVVFPLKLHRMIRAVYPSGDLDMDSEFFAEFAQRFKMFQIPDKL